MSEWPRSSGPSGRCSRYEYALLVAPSSNRVYAGEAPRHTGPQPPLDRGLRSATPAGGGSRSPLELLAAAVPGWEQLLRHGGVLGVAFHTHVAGRDRVAELLTGAGLTVVDRPGYRDLAHWVDQGISRDLVVAVKP